MKTKTMEYQIIRSRRKTISLQICADGKIVVRAPYRITDEEVRAFIQKKEAWIRKKMEALRIKNEKRKNLEPLSEEDLRELAKKAREVIPERLAYYAPRIGVTYGRVTIRNQRTRWGSCSSRGNLNFNCLLMLAPPEVLDSVIVHELCHRLEMNHSKRFYDEVLRVYPEYRRWYGWLREHGDELIARMIG